MANKYSARITSKLLALLLTCAPALSLQTGKVWECTGPQSKYTYLDCETDYSFSDGCYYVRHFSQFRPCGRICNDIEFNSIDEERCKAFCLGYLRSYCSLKEILTSTIPTTTTTSEQRASSPSTTVTEKNRPHISVPYLLLSVVAPLFGLFIIAFLVTLVLLFVRRKKQRLMNNGAICQPVWQPSSYEESKMVCKESEIPSECSEHEKLPTAENGFNDHLEKITF